MSDLGLSLVKALSSARRHSRHHSELGSGTKVTLRFPRHGSRRFHTCVSTAKEKVTKILISASSTFAEFAIWFAHPTKSSLMLFFRTVNQDSCGLSRCW